MRSLKKFIALALCVTLTISTLGQVKAEASAVGGVIGGGAAAAGVTLTAPQVALVLAAAGGVMFVASHADEISYTLNNALNAAATAVDNGVKELEEWWDTAKTGAIRMANAPRWIYNELKGWIQGLYTGATLPEGVVPDGLLLHGQLIPKGTLFNTLYYNHEIGLTMHNLGNETNGYANEWILGKYYSGTENPGVGDGVTWHLTAAVPYKGMQLPFMKSTGKSEMVTWNFTLDGQKYIYYGYNLGITLSSQTDVDNFNKAMPGAHYIGQTSSYTTVDLAKASITGSFPINKPASQAVKPSRVVGGVGSALEQGHSIDALNFPDIVVDGTGSICPDGVNEGAAAYDQSISATMDALIDGTMTWEDYIADVGTGSITVTIPGEDVETGAQDYPITNEGVSSVPAVKEEVEIDTELGNYSLSLIDFFPFCIPKDLMDLVGVLAAEPEAPAFTWVFPTLTGEPYELTIDLSVFDGVASIVRDMELLAFCIFLALRTRSLIRA